MWPFSSKIGLEDSGLLQGFTDCHCHLLPGVDDGVRTTQEAEAALAHFEKLGIRTVWLTPHITASKPSTTAFLRQRFDKLAEAYHGGITLRLSAEYTLDRLFCERFEAGDLLPWGKYGNRLLVEVSDSEAPGKCHELLDSITAKGFAPILAHPERCRHANILDYLELKARGVEFQLNLFSLVGLYGSRAKENAEMLLDEGLYEYAATDFHNLGAMASALREGLDKETIEQVKRTMRWQNYWQK